jgi:hypothetical protein
MASHIFIPVVHIDDSVELESPAILLTLVSNSEQSNHMASIAAAPDLLGGYWDEGIAWHR